MNILKLIFLSITVSLTTSLQGQITLNNPSFEDEPADATVPMGWFPCAPQTTPDILPGFWGVYSEASDGDTYVGLITRFDGSYESIGQRFIERLDDETCYSFNIDLAQSLSYAGYNEPLKIRIWISNKKCQKEQMVFESEFIEHSEWKTYKVEFTPEKRAKYILIEAYYTDGKITRTGNILLDNITPLIPCSKV
ncbi:hypothetical protein [Portibacter lacus]|uniref:CBM-cenC domain-containing protein n=1 Tax=Portibacter lacus TaxID=1099794 RepID=A0AA37WFJ1_9BACT|nr:hypothetical protein [Portibacter lacus]GLR20066.1 hypothetical protein GCM10007940_46820 [Portibacter lacus]